MRKKVVCTKKKKYTKEQLLFYLQKLSKNLKRTPKIVDMNKNKKYPSASTYMTRFGSWNNALKHANLNINYKKQFSKKDLIEDLKLLAKDLGSVPKTKDLTKKKWMATGSTYRKYFGSWKNALNSAKLIKISTTNLKQYVKK